ncbi:MAG: BRCT domain-containing protein, partial [Verrucomicrobiota bacterium]|nr:BRCT domain-containing protein [Verrucomicrobiota bacterium]
TGKTSLTKLDILNIYPSSANYAPVPSLEKAQNLSLSETTWVITGTLSESRNHFKRIIENNGGNVTGSISNKTNYLLAGQNPGSKLAKAEKLNVKVVSENELTSLISST